MLAGRPPIRRSQGSIGRAYREYRVCDQASWRGGWRFPVCTSTPQDRPEIRGMASCSSCGRALVMPFASGHAGVCASWPFEVSNAMRCSRTHRTRLDSTRLGAFGAQRPMYAAAASKPHRPCVAAAISTRSFARRRAWLLAASEHGRNVWICVHPLPAPTHFRTFQTTATCLPWPCGVPGRTSPLPPSLLRLLLPSMLPRSAAHARTCRHLPAFIHVWPKAT